MESIDQVATGQEGQAFQIIIWGAALLLAVLALGVFVLVMRRKMLSRSAVKASEAFSIADLKAMRASGQLTDEEFKQLRAAALGLAPPAEPIAATSEEAAENDGNCPLSEAGPADDS